MSKTDKKIDMILKDSAQKLKSEMEIYSYDDDDYVSRRKKSKIRKKKEKRKMKIKIAVLFAEIVVILGLAFALFMLIMPNSKAWITNTWFGKMFIKTVFSSDSYDRIFDKDYDRDNVNANEGLDTTVLDEYLNIALFGLDSRKGELGSGVQSDTIIIVSIKKETKEVKMASIYRDTYLRCINKDGSSYFGKINSSYNSGGAEASVRTLNANFDLNIKDYVTINFNGISNVIDLIGGIDVTLTKKEAWFVNGYLVETRKVTGLDAPDIKEVAGVHHLTGLQATAYCRIRGTSFYDENGNSLNDDFGRTARQRLVINKMVDGAKTLGLSAVLDMAEKVFESETDTFLTSIPYDDVIDLIPIVLEFTMSESYGFPGKYKPSNMPVYGDSLVPDNLAQTVVDLHKHLFGVNTFTPSKTVLGINEALCSKVGIVTDYNKNGSN